MRNAALSLFALLLCSTLFAGGHEVTTPVLGPSPLNTSSQHVATNGETFATIWYSGGSIYGALADATGLRLTSADVPLIAPSGAGCCGATAGLTAVGRDYFVFWSDSSGSYLANLGPDLKGRQIVRVADVPVLNTISVASNDSQILIAGQTGNIFPPAQTVAYLIHRDGSLVRDPVDLQSVGRLRASWSGKNFLIANATNLGLFLERISDASDSRTRITSASGRFSDPTPIFAAAASSGDANVLVWLEAADSPTPVTTFWSAVVNDDGTFTKQQIYSSPSNTAGGLANIIWNGQAFVATFGKLVFELDRNGSAIGSPIMIANWLTEITSIGDVIYGVDANVSVLQGTVLIRSESLSMTPAAQQDPAIASDGLDFMAVFREQTGSARSIKAAPVGQNATTSPGQPLLLSSAPFNSPPTIAHGKSVYLATWTEAGGLYASRISDDGVVLDTQPIRISTDGYAPDVAWNGRVFLEVWVGIGGIKAATIAEDGSVSPAHVVAADGGLEPRIAWNGKLFLLVYGVAGSCPFECPIFRAETKALRIGADGTPIDVTPTTLDSWQTPNPYAARATVASDGRDFLVALDAVTGAVVVNITTDGPSMTVGARTTVFRWFTTVTNDIRWNGHAYVLASTYGSAAKQWLSITHLDSMSRVFSETTSQPGTVPKLATNMLGDDAVILAEPAGNPPVTRAHVYFDSDFSPAPPPPAPPANVTAIGTPGHFTMSWSVGPDADGVLIETARGQYTGGFAVPPSTRSYTFNDSTITSVVLRTFNSGGMSPAVGALLQVPPRRRASR